MLSPHSLQIAMPYEKSRVAFPHLMGLSTSEEMKFQGGKYQVQFPLEKFA
jgi:hypothetical protein